MKDVNLENDRDAAAREAMEAELAWERAWRGKRKPNLDDEDEAAAIAAYDAATKRIGDARAKWNALNEDRR